MALAPVTAVFQIALGAAQKSGILLFPPAGDVCKAMCDGAGAAKPRRVWLVLGGGIERSGIGRVDRAQREENA